MPIRQTNGEPRAKVKLKEVPYFADPEQHRTWTYPMCDDHFVLLTKSDKKYLAR